MGKILNIYKNLEKCNKIVINCENLWKFTKIVKNDKIWKRIIIIKNYINWQNLKAKKICENVKYWQKFEKILEINRYFANLWKLTKIMKFDENYEALWSFTKIVVSSEN